MLQIIQSKASFSDMSGVDIYRILERNTSVHGEWDVYLFNTWLILSQSLNLN